MKVPDPQKIISKISQVNHIYPEQITLHFVTESPCPVGHYDPIRRESTLLVCDVCGGKGVIETHNTLTIPAGIEPVSRDTYEYLESGVFVNSELVCTIDSQEINQYSIDIKNITFIEYNGNEYRIDSYLENRLSGILYEYEIGLTKRK